MNRRLPLGSFAIVGATLVVFGLPGLAQALILDRAAIAAGEWWRLLTGHLVHFSFGHLFYDLLAFATAGVIIERRRYGSLLAIFVSVALLISVALLLSEPAMFRYAGLSGVACAALVYAGLGAIRESPPWRGAGVILLTLTGAKILVELVFGPLALVEPASDFVPMPLAHAIGGLAGVLAFALSRGSAWVGGVWRGYQSQAH